MTDYPYEGDLLAVVDGVTIPRIVQESVTQVCALVGAPDVRVQLDGISADAWWAHRMMQRARQCPASH